MPTPQPDPAVVRTPLAWSSSLGALYGLAYGVVCRLLFGQRHASDHWLNVAFPIMSLAFLFVVPTAVGAIAVTLGARAERRSLLYWIFAPWVPAAALLVVVFALAWEGVFCLVMAAPLLFGMASVGGLGAGLLLYWRRRPRAARGATLGLALLPFVLGPFEGHRPPPDALRDVETRVVIEADAATVWRQVVRVPSIGADEQSASFFHLIGVPRPDQATLDRDGVGGLRQARFHGGLRFDERVVEWQPARALGFTIAVVPGTVTPQVLDEHVRVGGEYFDVLHGRFRLEPLGARRTRLVLSSRHRLTTRLGAYAGLWSDAVMRDLQTGICAVIRRRSEAARR